MSDNLDPKQFIPSDSDIQKLLDKELAGDLDAISLEDHIIKTTLEHLNRLNRNRRE